MNYLATVVSFVLFLGMANGQAKGVLTPAEKAAATNCNTQANSLVRDMQNLATKVGDPFALQTVNVLRNHYCAILTNQGGVDKLAVKLSYNT